MNTATLSIVSIDQLVASPTNPRKHFDGIAHAELTASIREHGVMQPLLVRQSNVTEWPFSGSPATYEIVAGERRYRAAKAAGLTELPALIRDLSDAQVLEMQVIENLQRQDLHPLEEAEGYEALMKRHAYRVDDIAAKVGKSRAYVYGRMKLCSLSETWREALRRGKLLLASALMVARLKPSEQADLAEHFVAPDDDDEDVEPFTHQFIAHHVERRYMLDLTEAPFPIDAADLVDGAGPCTTCPRRAGNSPDLFPDIARGDTCTDADCFAAKRAAHNNRTRATAEAEGWTVISGKEAKKIKPNSYADLVGWAKYDGTTWIAGKDQRVSELVDDQAATKTMLQDPHTDDIYRIVPLAALDKALRAAGGQPTYQTRSTAAADRQRKEDDARKRKAKRELLARRRIHEAVRANFDGLLDDPPIMRLLATRMVDETYSSRLHELWGHKQRDELRAAIPGMSHDDLGRLVIDGLLADECEVGEYYYQRKTCDTLDALAGIYGVDTAAIRAQVDAELKAAEKTKAKKKAATKKAKKAAKNTKVTAK